MPDEVVMSNRCRILLKALKRLRETGLVRHQKFGDAGYYYAVSRDEILDIWELDNDELDSTLSEAIASGWVLEGLSQERKKHAQYSVLGSGYAISMIGDDALEQVRHYPQPYLSLGDISVSGENHAIAIGIGASASSGPSVDMLRSTFEEWLAKESIPEEKRGTMRRFLEATLSGITATGAVELMKYMGGMSGN